MKKIFLKTFAITAIFLLLAPNARADIFDLGNPTEVLDAILEDLGFEKDEVKDSAKTFNASRQKKEAPTVTLTFSPTNSAPGEKITVAAAPINFMGDPSQLYYTWYIKHNGSGGDDGKGNRDLNDDGDVDIEDYKIEAMRIIVNGGFDWEKAKNAGAYSASYSETGPFSGKYKAIFGGESQRGKYDNDDDAHCFYHDFETGDSYEMDDCQHLFPNARINNTTYETGNNKFSIEEKEFWRANPLTPDTAETGFNDEATVAGLGAIQLTWNYQLGDKVGVAVEGPAIDPTQEKDSTYKIMWAMPKNKCDIIGYDSTDDYPAGLTTTSATAVTADSPAAGDTTTILTETNTYNIIDNINKIATSVETIVITTTIDYFNGNPDLVTVTDSNGVAVLKPLTFDEYTGVATDDNGRVLPSATEEDIHMISINPDDLNDCLESNLIDPGEGGETKKLEVSLSYSPKNPVNDATGANAATLDISASVLGSKNNDLKYVWEVYRSDEINPVSWGTPMLKSELPEVGQTSGVGLSSLKFKLKLGEPIPKYLRVKVLVTEQISESAVSEGNSDVIIPISNTTDQIRVYPVEASDSLTLSLVEDKERCNSDMEQVVCPVAKNEIVGIKVPVSTEAFSNIRWTLDGALIKPLSYADGDCLSGECDPVTGDAADIAYFPVLKEMGERYLLNFTATAGANKKINLTKTFEVINPKINIVSNDEASCQPLLLGSYVDLDGKLWPDYSDTSFQTVAEKTISLKPNFNVSFVTGKQWIIDDVVIDADPNIINPFGATIDTATDILTFPVNKTAGENYTVAYSALYGQNNNIKKILNSSFGVQLNEFYEEQLDANIEIAVVDALDGAPVTKAITPKKILAALITDVPAYLNFLFRIVLTIGLFLFVSWIVLAIFPKTNYDE